MCPVIDIVEHLDLFWRWIWIIDIVHNVRYLIAIVWLYTCHIYCTVVIYHNKDTHTNDFTLSSKSVMKLLFVFCSTGIGLTLNNVQYTNNSVVTITDIGTGSAALLCTTTYYGPCCFSGPPPGTHWYLPNGTRVERFNTLPYYRSRIDGRPWWYSKLGTVVLHRNPRATTTGVFRCEILDATGVFQSIYVGIYTATTGESCVLKSNMFL